MNSINHWKVGAFVLGGFALAFLVLVWVGSSDFRRNTRLVVTYFDESVQGLDAGSSFKFRGVQIGTVKEISVAPDLRHVRVTSQVYEDVLERLGLNGDGSALGSSRGELRVQLASAGVTGVKFLSLDFFDPVRYPLMDLPFDPGPDYFPSTRSSLKSIEEAVIEVGSQLPMLTMQASQTLTKLADTFDEFSHTIGPLVARDGAVSSLLAQYQRTGARFEDAASELESQIRAAQVAQTAASVREAADSFGGFSSDASAAIEELRVTLASLQSTLSAVRTFAEYLERDPSALLRGRSSRANADEGRP